MEFKDSIDLTAALRLSGYRGTRDVDPRGGCTCVFSRSVLF